MFVRKNVQIVKVKELKRFFGKIIDFIGFKFLSFYLESAIIHVHGQRIKGNNLFCFTISSFESEYKYCQFLG